MTTFNLGNLRQDNQIVIGDQSAAINAFTLVSGDLQAQPGVIDFSGTLAPPQRTLYDTTGELHAIAGGAAIEAVVSVASRIIVGGDIQSGLGFVDGFGRRGIGVNDDIEAGAASVFGQLLNTQALRANGDLQAQASQVDVVLKNVRLASGDLVATGRAQVDVSFNFYGRWTQTAGQSVVWQTVTTQRS